MEIHRLEACPACGAGGGAAVDLGEGRTLLRCPSCDVRYAPEFADPEAIYVDGYLKGETDFGLDIMHPVFQAFLDHCAAVRLGRIERVLGRTGSLLDVGCGSGEVLRVAARRGWQGIGVEPVAESAAMARERGLDVRTTTLEASGLPERSFDVVSAFHVLEHMTDGVGFLRTLARWARPGGLVVIEVPNWHSFHRRNNGPHWPGLRPLEHVAHYEPKTLAATLRRAGLVPRRVRSIGFLWEGQTVDQALDDLARPGWARRFGPLTRRGVHDGQPAVVPNRLGWAVLRGTQAAYEAAGVGQVVLAIAEAP
jgi:2-polyprenyl-3-methyl-5-hydroxy-6-metoxy-1,4-benzoquinol methylase